MFCKNCGKEMNDDSAFCNNCGTIMGETDSSEPIRTVNNNFEDNVVQLDVKPTFNWGYQLLLLLKEVVVTLLLVEIFLVRITVLLSSVYLRMYGILIIAVVVLIHFIKLLFQRVQYKRLEYRFLRTKIEYVDGFLNKEEKEVKYKYIREVIMKQDILERMFNLGKIYLFTNASSGVAPSRNNHKQTNKNGIIIHCVENVHDTLKQIKQIIDNGDTDDQ